jgi:hypothetical protein
MKVQVIQDSLILNGTFLIPVYADNINILGGSLQTVKKRV